jgi:hypothetical protein
MHTAIIKHQTMKKGIDEQLGQKEWCWTSAASLSMPQPGQFDDANEDEYELMENHVATKKRKSSKGQVMRMTQKCAAIAACSICGRTDFVAATHASRHEADCNGSSNPNGPWNCKICGRSSFATSQAFAGHIRCCNKGQNVSQTIVSLRPPALETERILLSDFNWLVTEALELFEATESDVAKQIVGSGRRRIVVGNVGIRCVHCARAGVLACASIAYTYSLKTLPHNMGGMVTRHLLKSCQHMDPTLRLRMCQVRKTTARESMSKGRIGLPAYLRLLVTKFDLTDNGESNGVWRQHDDIEESQTPVAEGPVATAGWARNVRDC